MGTVARVRTRWFPLYSAARELLTVLVGVSKAEVAALLRDVWDKAGTYSARVDWSEPDKWISERLSGSSAALAWRIWKDSGRRVNPRHMYGAYLLVCHHELAKVDAHGVFYLSEAGKGFLADQFATLLVLDEAEGLLFLLNLVVMRGRSKRGDIIPEWAEFLSENSDWKGPEMVRDSLRRRLANLVDRGLVSRQAGVYTATDPGLDYLSRSTAKKSDPSGNVLRAVLQYNTAQRDALRKRLEQMTPRGFEFLVAELLEAMGYIKVEVSSKGPDRGVDIKATGLIGTTPIKQAFQVKHWRRNVGTRVLKELRGSLVEHNATLGTIVTLGKFAKGCIEASATDRTAPIGLIDGDKLVDLLIKHEVGIRRRSVDLYELDADALDELSKEHEEDRPVEE